MPRRLTRQERAARAYAGGATLREIGEEHGVHGKTVWTWLLEQGVARTRRRGPRGRTDVTDAQVVELRDDVHLSYAAIAAELGMSQAGVRKRYARAVGDTAPWMRHGRPAR